jgi:hypothetical protein
MLKEENLIGLSDEMKRTLEVIQLIPIEYFKNEEPLIYNFKTLYNIDFNEVLNSLPQSSDIAYYTGLYFYSCKYLSHVTDIPRIVEEKILSCLNAVTFNHFVLDSYKYRICSYHIDEKYTNLINAINRVKIDEVDNYFNPDQLNSLYLNQIAFVNYIEYTIAYFSKDLDEFQKYQITTKQLSLLILYFTWREIAVRVFLNKNRRIKVLCLNTMRL